MEKKCTVADGNVDEAMVKIYCLTCGKFIGRAAPGNLSTGGRLTVNPKPVAKN